MVNIQKKICISIWGDKINEAQLQKGNELKIDFDMESRDYNGRWYIDIKAWKIEVVGTDTQIGSDNSVNRNADIPTIEEESLPF